MNNMEDPAMKSRWNSAFVVVIVAVLGPANTARSYPGHWPDLSIEKTADVDVVAPGGLITYTLFASNPSLHPAHDVLVTDVLPDGVIPLSWHFDNGGAAIPSPTYVRFGPDECVWGMERMMSFDRFWIELTVRVDPSYSLDTIENVARIVCSELEWNFDNNEGILITRVEHSTIPAPGAALLTLIGAALTTRLRKRSKI